MWRKIALGIALSMIVSLTGPSVAATTFGDTAGTSCETAVEVLSALGIVNGKSASAYEPESTLTRAEMTAIILRTMNMESVDSGKDLFADVPKEHWAYANIASAYQLGIINGINDEMFAPDDAVTYGQAVKMVVASLGYTLQAETLGGYPSGYLVKAAQLDILKGVAQESKMTRGNMAVLLYNALDVPMFLQSTYGQESYDYAVSEQDTLLSYYLKVDKVTSYVSATPMAQITVPSRTLLSDEVAIEADGLIVKKGGTNVQDMLGVRAVFYMKEESDGDTPIVLAAVLQSGTEVLDIEGKAVDSETTKNQLVYTENGRIEKVDISGAKLVWNGRVKTNWNESDLQPALGTVRIIRTGNAASYIIVESFENYVVDTVVPDTMEIFFMKGNNPDAELDKVIVDPDDRHTMLTDEIREPIPIEGCARWDVVSVAESADKTVRKLIRCYNVVKGTVNEIGDEYVQIDSTTYPLTGTLAVGSMELGQTAAYYLDFTGAVAAVDESFDVSRNYGWLVSARPQKGVDARIQLKIFTQEGTMQIFDAADRVIVDGITFANADLLDGTNALMAGGAVYPQLLKYKTNAEGKITELDTAENRTLQAYTDAEKTDGTFSMGYYMGKDRAAVEFNGTKAGGQKTGTTQYNLGGVIFARVRVTNETPVFNIPRDPAREELYEIDTMRAYSWDVYNSTKYLAVYDVDEEFNAGACVVHNYLDSEDGEAAAVDTYPQYTAGNLGLITGVSLTLNEEGEAVRTLKLYTWTGGEETVRAPEGFECLYRSANADFLEDPYWYNVKGQPRDETLIQSTSYNNPNSSYYGYEFRPQTMRLDAKDLQPGDVLHYSAANGELTMGSVVFRSAYPGKIELVPSVTSNSLSMGNINVTSESNFYLGGRLQMYATVVRTTENGPILSTNLSNMAGQPNGKTALRAIPTSGRFVLWDAEKQTMRTITPGEIRVGDELLSIWKTNTQMLVIVYR